MNIYGYGIDLIDINRLGRKLEKSPNLLKRIYNKNEIKRNNSTNKSLEILKNYT